MDKLKLFVIWLSGYMDACGKSLNEEQTKVVQDKLNNLFEHEAVPEKKTLEELGEEHGFPVHQGFPDKNMFGHDNDGFTLRC